MRLFILIAASLFSGSAFTQSYYMFVGTYTNGASEGIYVYRFNAASGTASKISSVKTKNPSYLAISASGKYLYAVNENGGDQEGGVSSFAIDAHGGKLHFLNAQGSGGADPCYISVNEQGNWAVVANYSSGSLSALPVKANGYLNAPAEMIQHQGSSQNPQRQEKAHVHSVVFSPDQRYIFCADLGMDKESIYRFDPNQKMPLSAARDSFVNIIPGSGPRHFVFSKNGRYAYLIEELSGTVDGYHYENGTLINFQHISTHPDDFTGTKGSADIHISPDGRFLYASNRGDANSIAVFSIDPGNGRLRIKGFTPTGGKTPRNFIIDPTGRYLLVANQDSSNVVVFRINSITGLLKATGIRLDIPNPVCLKMLRIRS
jgi:6-phosphogluconolactonase